MPEQQTLLWMKNVYKSFPGVQALEQVSLHVYPGEVLGLIGQNGAGKSTLMKILSGVYAVEEGEIYFEGEPVQIRNPQHAQALGIAIIYQELNLMPNLTVMENIFIGREPGPPVFFSRRRLQNQTQQLLDQLKMDLSPTATVRNLSVAEQQMVEIAKTISRQVKVIIMDEPTSSLSETEVETLFAVIDELKQKGIGIIFISHRLEEVLHICDRVTVLRDGQHVGDTTVQKAVQKENQGQGANQVQSTTQDDLIQMMVGALVGDLFSQGCGRFTPLHFTD